MTGNLGMVDQSLTILQCNKHKQDDKMDTICVTESLCDITS